MSYVIHFGGLMSKMISARVPDAVYEQALSQLDRLGANPSDLVNAAFEYLVEERALPKPSTAKAVKTRALSREQRHKLSSFFRSCTIEVAMPTDVSYDKRVIAEAKGAKYEALA